MSQFLPFYLGPEVYALELPDIQEVVENQQVYPVPGAPEPILGAISFHGRVVPVVDLPFLLGFPAGQRSERMIVLIDDYGPVALTVERLQRIISLDLAQRTLSQSDSEADCIRGVLDLDGKMLSLLDLEQLGLLLEQLCSEFGG